MVIVLQHYHRDQNIRPLSYAQQRMWLLDRLDPGNPAYNITRVIRLHGALSITALQESLREIVARHESLRTTFTEIEGEPVQVIAANYVLEIPIIDLSHFAWLTDKTMWSRSRLSACRSQGVRE
jgi:hypothetical protein